MHRNKSVNVHQFSMVPRPDVPRSSFRMQKAYKTSFDSGRLYPIFVEEVLPGDTFNLRMTAFCRLATPLFPIMDNCYLETFFFFVPNRLVWTNWKRFMGERDPNPSSSTSYVVPYVVSPPGGYSIGSIADYMGLPTVGQVGAGNTFEHSALPIRAFWKIYNEWFRDENLNISATVQVNDGPDSNTLSGLTPIRRGKRHDYFTSALPWTQKGNPVQLPLGSTAPVMRDPAGAGFDHPRFFSAPNDVNLTATQGSTIANYDTAAIANLDPIRWASGSVGLVACHR